MEVGGIIIMPSDIKVLATMRSINKKGREHHEPDLKKQP